MRKVIVSEFVTLDGVMEDPGGAEKFQYGGWTMPYWNDEIGKVKFDELFASDTLLLGRVTYQGFATAWPSMTDEAGFADRMNGLPKYVVSTTLEKVEWNNSRLIKGNIVEEISKLKQQPGQDILTGGSGELVRTLMQHDLIDGYRLLVYPVVLGKRGWWISVRLWSFLWSSVGPGGSAPAPHQNHEAGGVRAPVYH